MDRIVLLPKISISDLERRVLNNSSSYVDRPSKKSSGNPLFKEIKITSPFYNKIKHHHQKCECQYHRMKRYQENVPKFKHVKK